MSADTVAQVQKEALEQNDIDEIKRVENQWRVDAEEKMTAEIFDVAASLLKMSK